LTFVHFFVPEAVAEHPELVVTQEHDNAELVVELVVPPR
jgi:hypothetical protein